MLNIPAQFPDLSVHALSAITQVGHEDNIEHLLHAISNPRCATDAEMLMVIRLVQSVREHTRELECLLSELLIACHPHEDAEFPHAMH